MTRLELRDKHVAPAATISWTDRGVVGPKFSNVGEGLFWDGVQLLESKELKGGEKRREKGKRNTARFSKGVWEQRAKMGGRI